MVIYMERDSVDKLTEADIKEIIEENEIDQKYGEMEKYYRGDHPILHQMKKDTTAPNNQIVNNMPRYVTDTAVGYFLGKPVVYSSQDDTYMKTMQDIFDYNDEQDENVELAKKCSIGGDCFEMLYMDEDANIRFTKILSSNVIMICETGFDTPLRVIRIIHSKDKNKWDIKKVEYWDQEDVWYFHGINGGPLELLDIQPHYWNDVPFIYYINNEDRLGDFEGIVSIVDAYNRAQSNTANYFQYNDEALLKVLKMGDVSSQDIADMKEKGAIILEDGGDIQWLIKEVSDGPLENYKKRLREDMHIFSSVPNLTDTNFGSDLSGVAVSYKLWSLEQVCAIKERKFKRGLQRRIELITNMLNLMGGSYDYRDIEIQFRRNKPQNMLEIAQIVQTLSPLLSKESRLKMLPNVDNPQEELDKLEKEQTEEERKFGTGAGYQALAAAFNSAAGSQEEKNTEEVNPDDGKG